MRAKYGYEQWIENINLRQIYLNYKLFSVKMTKLYHVLFIMAIIVVGVESGYVPCPNVTNFTGCQTCYQYTPLSPI